jgi:hypothetical protein
MKTNTKIESRFPPLQEGDPTTNPYPEVGRGWVCFHCGERFTTVGSAQDHFGGDPDSEPGCILKVKLGDERGMLMAIRQIEAGLMIIQACLNEENWDIGDKPEDAINKVWHRVHDLMHIVQPWRNES